MADGWIGLSQLGYLLPVPIIGPVSAAGGTLSLTVQSISGVSYQLQSKSLITGGWGDSGAPVAGTGGEETITVTLSEEEEYFRVKVE